MPAQVTAYPLDDISADLVAILKTIKDPADNTQYIFQNPDDATKYYIYDYSTNQFDGTPAVVVFPSGGSAMYDTVVENLRTYEFFVGIAVDLQTRTKSQAYKLLRQLTDAVITAIDKTFDLNGGSDFVLAIPVAWAAGESTMGEIVYAPLKISVQKTIPLV